MSVNWSIEKVQCSTMWSPHGGPGCNMAFEQTISFCDGFCFRFIIKDFKKKAFYVLLSIDQLSTTSDSNTWKLNSILLVFSVHIIDQKKQIKTSGLRMHELCMCLFIVAYIMQEVP